MPFSLFRLSVGVCVKNCRHLSRSNRTSWHLCIKKTVPEQNINDDCYTVKLVELRGRFTREFVIAHIFFLSCVYFIVFIIIFYFHYSLFFALQMRTCSNNLPCNDMNDTICVYLVIWIHVSRKWLNEINLASKNESQKYEKKTCVSNWRSTSYCSIKYAAFKFVLIFFKWPTANLFSQRGVCLFCFPIHNLLYMVFSVILLYCILMR